MSFWYKERQKMALWWNGISRQEIRSYVYTAVLFLFLTFLYFLSIHISGLFSWYRFQRSMVECFIMLFLTQLMTGKNMLHPFWRIGYIPFALWITILLSHSRPQRLPSLRLQSYHPILSYCLRRAPAPLFHDEHYLPGRTGEKDDDCHRTGHSRIFFLQPVHLYAPLPAHRSGTFP